MNGGIARNTQLFGEIPNARQAGPKRNLAAPGGSLKMADNLIGDGCRPASVYFELRQQWHEIRPRITHESKKVRVRFHATPGGIELATL
jgi:hypothetical protein